MKLEKLSVSCAQLDKAIWSAGTVVLLQQVLQLYAGMALLSSFQPLDADDKLLEDIFSSRETEWLSKLRSKANDGSISESSFLTALQRKMEETVLALPSGSNAQRIQVQKLLNQLPVVWSVWKICEFYHRLETVMSRIGFQSSGRAKVSVNAFVRYWMLKRASTVLLCRLST